MRILITTELYAPVVNGVVTSVMNLRKGLLQRGHDVRVLTLSQTTRSFERDGVIYIGSVDAGKIYPGARLKSAFAGSYIQDILEWSPEIVHSQCEFSTFILAMKIAKKLDIPIVHTYHTVYEDYTHYFSLNKKWGRSMAASLSRWVLNRANCVIAPTEKVRRIITGYGIDTDIRIVPTGIDVGSFASAPDPERLSGIRRSLGIPAEMRIILYAGRLAMEKNLEEIFSSYARLRPEKTRLLIVGDGPHRAALERMAEQLDIKDAVVFAGMIPPENMSDYYHTGNLFVSASTSETQGLTYIEALAAGLPVLCRDDDCLNGVVINGLNGWRYETAEDFSRKLAFLLQNSDRLEALSRNAGLTAVRDFSAAVFSEKAESVYTDAIRAVSASAPYRKTAAYEHAAG